MTIKQHDILVLLKPLIVLMLSLVNVSSTFSQRDDHLLFIEELNEEINQSQLNNEPLGEQLQFYNYGLAYVEKLPEIHEARALLYFRYSKFLQKVGYYDEALKYGLALISIVEDQNYIGEYHYIYHDLGKIYLKLGKFDQALKIEKGGLERRIKLADQIDTNKNYHFLFNELGLTYFHIGEYDSAIFYYDKALNSGFHFNDHYLFILLENKAEALIKKGDELKSAEVIQTLKLHPGRYENDRRNINYFLLLAERKLLIGDWNKATSALDSAKIYLQVSSEKEEPEIWNRYYQNRYHQYILKSDRKELSQFEIIYNTFKDSLTLLEERSILMTQNSHFSQIIENQELRLTNEKLASEQSKAQLREEELSSRNKSLLLIVAVLLFGITVSIIFRIYVKKTKEKLELERELSHSIEHQRELTESIKFKENDIQTLSNYLMGSSEQMNNLKDILKRINRIQNPEEKETVLLNFIIDSRQRIQHLESDKEMLENIQDINAEFHDRLLKTHPSLTKGDLQYCGFVKTGLTNTQIAAKKNTSVNTVKTAKHRLKKKMNLAQSEKLESYLKAL